MVRMPALTLRIASRAAFSSVAAGAAGAVGAADALVAACVCVRKVAAPAAETVPRNPLRVAMPR
ncbi:hypothetical protein, partial [Streptomyces sp. SP2-10]|uniref:hypothetical protein n=1 Tax=Streptomyces sp. SP2-10 TaxID=2873385 RepID=UPI001CA68964